MRPTTSCLPSASRSFCLRFAQCAGALVAACAALTANCAEPSQALCAEFGQFLNAPDSSGIDRRQLQTSPGNGQQYDNLDIDGDDVNDVVEGGCSASLQPADPCMLVVELSTGKKLEVEFEIDERFFLVRHRSRIYAIATAAAQSGKPVRSILRLDANGMTRICSGFTCNAVNAQEDQRVTQRNTQEINACVKQQLDVAEAELNAAYKEVLARLAKPDGLGRPQDGVRARLVEAQRHWIQFREKNCDALLMQEADGSARSSQYMGCKRGLAQQRAEQLRRWFLS